MPTVAFCAFMMNFDLSLPAMAPVKVRKMPRAKVMTAPSAALPVTRY